MKLSLITDMHYRPSDKSFDGLIADIDRKETGYDAFSEYELSFTDESFSLRFIRSGEKDPYSNKEKALIEQGVDIGARDGETISIPSGSYEFIQLPVLFSEKELPKLVLPFSAHARKIYVRLFKENMLETVMQLLIS